MKIKKPFHSLLLVRVEFFPDEVRDLQRALDDPVRAVVDLNFFTVH